MDAGEQVQVTKKVVFKIEFLSMQIEDDIGSVNDWIFNPRSAPKQLAVCVCP